MKRRNVIFILILLSLFVFSIILPTFSKIKSVKLSREWDKTVASSFNSGTGTENDPYIISNPSEFAYFSYSLQENDYDGEYIKLSSDIIINDGVFKNGENITYLYNGELYYLDTTTSKYYSDEQKKHEVGSVNLFPTIDGFKGTFDGDFHTIYGFYKSNDDSLSLFDNLEGTIENVYIDNTFIYGGHLSSGVVLNASNSNISNIVFNGNVIGSKVSNDKVLTKSIPEITVDNNYHISLDTEIVSASKYVLSGSCNGDTFVLNDVTYSCSNIEIELNTNSVDIIGDGLTFNLNYDIYYDENKSAGIVLYANNTNITGVVNHGTVDNTVVAGLVGSLINGELTNSYNDGNLIGEYVSSISDITSSTVDIINVYNNGLVDSSNGSMFGNIIDGTLNINKVFNKRDDKPIFNVVNSLVTINNSYSNTRYTDLYNSSFLAFTVTAYENYPQYIDNENITNGNIWVHNDLPLLYFDDLKNKTVSIKIGNTSWNTSHEIVDNVIYNESITVMLATSDIYKPIKDVYYYISSNVITDLSTIEWNEYTGTINLSNEGFYNIYVKYIDYNDVITYINSDTVILDFEGSDVAISSNNNSWTDLHTPANIYNDNQLGYEISATDAISGINKIEYIISNTILGEDVLSNVTEWVTYSNNFTVSNQEPYIVYVKVTDNGGYITYANSDYVIPATFHINNLKSGNNLVFNSYMNYKSSFNFNVTLDHTYINSNFNRYLYSTNALPVGTIVILKDLNTSVTYKYVAAEVQYNNQYNGYLYPLSSFEEVGKATFKVFFNNTINTNENYNISIDFKNTDALGDYSFDLIATNDNEVIRINSNESIDIHIVNVEGNYLSITNGNTTLSNDVMSIPFNLVVNSLQNDNVITDTKIENMYNGISISLVDELNNVIDRDLYSNIRFRYNGNIYVPNLTSKTNIPLGANITKSFNVDVLLAPTSLEPGTYYFKVTGYLSVDGINKYYETSNSVRIPIEISNNINIENYSFDVSLNNSSIVKKGDIVTFDVDLSGIDNPYIYVSLYKKKDLTAYNQEYVLVDLKDYVTDNLSQSNGKYLVDISNPVYNLESDIETNGYKLLFELYDGDIKISDKEIKLIIR